MRMQQTTFRLSTALAITGVAFGPLTAQLAWAQSQVPRPLPPLAPAAGAAATADVNAADPPSRVGRLARVTGTVSFHTADEDHWEPATVNYPVTTGNAFWTEPQSAAAIDIDAAHAALDQQTEFDIDTLDAQDFAATEAQGAVYLNIRLIGPGQIYSIATPRGTVSIAAVGRYEIVAGDTERPTTVTVVDGAAQVTGSDLALQIGPHQTASVVGTDNFQGGIGPESDDTFLAAQLLAEQALPPLAQAASGNATQTTTVVRRTAYVPSPEVQQMTGSEDLATTGDWSSTPQYGHVWYPPVAHDWVPYRHGHWAYVQPWGWTWVDDASWGFAPFHYGRWVQVDQRWGWTPGVVHDQGYVAPAYGTPQYQPPVYAPALVSFVDVAAGVAIGAAIGLVVGAALSNHDGGGPSVGWVPLAPNEPYYPPYHVSQNYVRNVNVNSVRNVTSISNVTNTSSVVNNTTVNNYANQAAATVVPQAAMAQSRPVAQAAVAVTPQQFAQARQVRQVPVQPTMATAGVTPAVARSLKLQPVAGAAAPVRPAAPGPQVLAAPARPAAANPVAARSAAATPASAVPGALRPGAVVPGVARAAAAPAVQLARPALRPAAVAAAHPIAPGQPPLPTPKAATAAPAAATQPALAKPTGAANLATPAKTTVPAIVPHPSVPAATLPAASPPVPKLPVPTLPVSRLPVPAVNVPRPAAPALAHPAAAAAAAAAVAVAPATKAPTVHAPQPASVPTVVVPVTHSAVTAPPVHARAVAPHPAAPIAVPHPAVQAPNMHMATPPHPAALAPHPAATAQPSVIPAPHPAAPAPHPVAPAPHPAAPAPHPLAPAPHPATPALSPAAPAPHPAAVARPLPKVCPPGQASC